MTAESRQAITDTARLGVYSPTQETKNAKRVRKNYMSNTESAGGWTLALRTAGLIVPVFLALFGLLWGTQSTRIDALDDRISRVESRQEAANERILAEIQGLRAEIRDQLATRSK